MALKGRTPLGYYKDPEKSAATFVVVDGVRYSIPGDFAEVDADGTVKLLGPGLDVHQHRRREGLSPRRSRRSLKLHPDVADAVVVGVPDERFGEAVTAMVEAAPGATVDERRPHRPREEPPLALQGAQAGATSSTPSAGPRTARSTTGACRPRPALERPDAPRLRPGGGTRNRWRGTSVHAHDGRSAPTQEDTSTMPNPVLNDKTFEKAEAEAGWAAPAADTASAPPAPSR